MKKLLIVALMLTGGIMYVSAQTTGKSCCSKNAASGQKSCCSKDAAATQKSCHGDHGASAAGQQENEKVSTGNTAGNPPKKRSNATEKSLNKAVVNRDNSTTPAKTE